MLHPDHLIPLLNLINARGVEFKAAVIGGVAAIAHGVYRATLDLDILVDSGDVDLVNFKMAIQKILIDNDNIIPGLEDLGPLTLGFQAAARPGGNEPLKNAVVGLIDKNGDRIIDFLGSYWNYDREALNSSVPLEGFGSLRVVDVPYLILMKLRANSPRDKLDIYEIFYEADEMTRLKALDVIKEYGKSGALRGVLKLYGFEIDTMIKDVEEDESPQG